MKSLGELILEKHWIAVQLIDGQLQTFASTFTKQYVITQILQEKLTTKGGLTVKIFPMHSFL